MELAEVHQGCIGTDTADRKTRQAGPMSDPAVRVDDVDSAGISDSFPSASSEFEPERTRRAKVGLFRGEE
jgi:hypothetical protein